MPDILIIGTPEGVAEFDPEDNPADTFPCLFAGAVHKEARAQLYAIITKTFFDEALQMEFFVRELDQDGPYIYQFESQLVTELSYFPEDDVDQLNAVWSETYLDLNMEDAELADFIFQLVNFCQVVHNDDELHLYVISDA